MSERRPAHILLIDDALVAYEALQALLGETRAPYTVEWRPDYDSGREALLTGAFDLCLLDEGLGGRSGLELLAETQRAGNRTPVVMLTADDRAELDERALAAGAMDFLVKGDFTAPTFERVVRYAIERGQTLERLRDSEERYALALEGSNDGLWDYRLADKALHLSPRWKGILGFGPDELPSTLDSWWGRIHEEDRARVLSELERHVMRAETPFFESEHRLLHRDGSWRHVLARGRAVRDAGGTATRMAGSLTDVTLARGRDALTELPNRLLFLDRLEHAFLRAQRDPDARFSVLFIDLDRFKVINEGLGHSAGDELLVGIARRLERCLRVVDTVARLSGDEFVALLDDTRGPDGPIRVATRIIEELARPFRLQDREVVTGASVGIAMSGPQYQRPGELLRDADTAMHRAKAEGRGRFALFDDDMHAQAVKVLSVESGLRRALDARELEVHYQPVVTVPGQRPKGFEALVRWRHPERGLISPAEFIPIAEDSGLIVLLDLYVLREACRQLALWRQVVPELTMSVNASRRNFSNPNFVIDVLQALAMAGVPAGALHLEITESITMEGGDLARQHLEQLSAAGVKLVVDDFGVHYSSLSVLHQYPFTGLKLDRSFVSALQASAQSAEVVRAVLAMAAAFNLSVVGEGVETASQEETLVRLGCTTLQGYRYSKPLPVDAADRFLTASVQSS